MTANTCHMPDPADYPDLIEPPEEWGHWRTASGFCRHTYCAEGNAVGRLYRWAHPRREVVVEDHGAYVVTAELAP